jgi:pimeloyl-ACP methyl ester carboxylesterase
MSTVPVILVHGIGSSFEHNWVTPGWRDLLSESGRTVVGVELPGHGRSTEPTDREAAGLIEDQARKAGRVDAVGFSAGANALLVAASRSPELFATIAVLGVGDSSLRENQPGVSGWRDDLAAALESDNEPGPGLPLVIRRLAESAGNDRWSVAAYARSTQPAPHRPELARITARCLVVEGSADLVGPADHIAQVIPDCRRVVLKGVDHFAIPSDFGCLDAVLGFLDE